MCVNKIKKEERWLFTDWGFALRNFKIYDSYNSFKLITERKLSDGEYTNWFNIDNVKREIQAYQEKHPEIKLRGITETLKTLESHGFSYKNSQKKQAQLDADKRNKNYITSNQFSKKIRLID